MILLSSTMSLLIFWLLDLSAPDRVMLKFSTVRVDTSISSYNNISFCLMCFDDLSNEQLRIVMSSWIIGLFIIMKCPSLIPIIFLALKSALFEINIVTSTSFWFVLAWHIFLHPFTFNLYVSLYLKWGTCRQHTVGSCFFIH